MATIPPDGANPLRAFLDEVVVLEGVVVTRETALTLISMLDQDEDLVLTAGLLPAEHDIPAENVFSLRDAHHHLLTTRTAYPIVVSIAGVRV